MDEYEKKELMSVIDSGWFTEAKKTKEFERKFADFTNCKYACTVTSGTAGLYLGLLAMELKKNDEVIVPALSWISTANVVENVGCKTVFCDIDLSTFNINLDDLRSKITNNTKAIIPVHLFGYPIDIEIIKGIIGDRYLSLIHI